MNPSPRFDWPRALLALRRKYPYGWPAPVRSRALSAFAIIDRAVIAITEMQAITEKR